MRTRNLQALFLPHNSLNYVINHLSHRLSNYISTKCNCLSEKSYKKPHSILSYKFRISNTLVIKDTIKHLFSSGGKTYTSTCTYSTKQVRQYGKRAG